MIHSLNHKSGGQDAEDHRPTHLRGGETTQGSRILLETLLPSQGGQQVAPRPWFNKDSGLVEREGGNPVREASGKQGLK